jgi:hypothetical protein
MLLIDSWQFITVVSEIIIELVDVGFVFLTMSEFTIFENILLLAIIANSVVWPLIWCIMKLSSRISFMDHILSGKMSGPRI